MGKLAEAMREKAEVLLARVGVPMGINGYDRGRAAGLKEAAALIEPAEARAVPEGWYAPAGITLLEMVTTEDHYKTLRAPVFKRDRHTEAIPELLQWRCDIDGDDGYCVGYGDTPEKAIAATKPSQPKRVETDGEEGHPE